MHNFMFTDPQASYDRLETIIEARQIFDSLHDLTAIIKLADYMEAKQAASVPRQALWMMGSWCYGDSELVNSKVSSMKWVNPHYAEKTRFSDAIVVCECGKPMLALKDDRREPAWEEEFADHNGCTIAARYRTRARLCERRAEILRVCVPLGVSARSLSDRLAMGESALGRFAEKMHVDVGNAQQTYLQHRRETARVLAEQYSAKEIAAAYGVSAGIIRKDIKRATGRLAQDFYNSRR